MTQTVLGHTIFAKRWHMGKRKSGDRLIDMKNPEDASLRLQYTNHAIEGLMSDNDRTTAIIGASLVDEILEEILRAQFEKNSDEETIDRLFNHEGVLGSFSSKIDMGYCLGMYGSQTHANLRRVKDIRNRFAHKIAMFDSRRNPTPVTFQSQQIVSMCEAFTQVNLLPLPAKSQAKERFINVCQSVVLYLREKEAVRRFGDEWLKNPHLGPLDLP